MTECALRKIIAEAVSLDREIADKTDRFKELKSQIIAEAESRDDDHVATDGGGTSWSAEGADGCVARVTWPAPSLRASIDAEKPAGARVMEAVGRWKDQLFTPVLKYVPIEKFRERVVELFEAVQARKIIRWCETPSTARVSFETKEPSTTER